MERKPLRTWKNKQRKSLYTEEGDVGFIYKKLPNVEGEQEMPEAVPSDTTGAVMVAEEEEKEVRIGEEESLSESLLEDLDGELKKDVEVRRFIADLRKELLSTAEEPLGDEVDRALEQVAQDVRGSDLYFRYMESADLKRNPLVEEMKNTIASFGVKIELCEREIGEWEEVVKMKTEEAEQDKRDHNSERELDFLHLRLEDEEALKTYLSPGQKELLDQNEGLHSGFREETSKQLERINTSIDGELRRAHEYCQRISRKLAEEPLDLSIGGETPRTLFKAMKNYV